MQSDKILEDLKNGGSYCLHKEISSFNEVYYEQYLFYVHGKNKFIRQYVDWEIFIQRGFNKNSMRFEYIDTNDARILVESLIEKGLDD